MFNQLNCDEKPKPAMHRCPKGTYAQNICPAICRPFCKERLCDRIKRVQESSKVLENVLDIASTLVDVMIICGINERKANEALDVVIYAFMHFDEVAEHPGAKCKKRIRKDEFINDLMKDCCMTKDEAKLAYSIVKSAFKAFYHKQIVQHYDATFVDECEWKNAANRTVNALIKTGATDSETDLIGRRIFSAYENYITRLHTKRRQSIETGGEPCTLKGSEKVPGPQGVGVGGADISILQRAESDLTFEMVCSNCMANLDYHRPKILCKDSIGRVIMVIDGDRITADPNVGKTMGPNVPQGKMGDTVKGVGSDTKSEKEGGGVCSDDDESETVCADDANVKITIKVEKCPIKGLILCMELSGFCRRNWKNVHELGGLKLMLAEDVVYFDCKYITNIKAFDLAESVGRMQESLGSDGKAPSLTQSGHIKVKKEESSTSRESSEGSFAEHAPDKTAITAEEETQTVVEEFEYGQGGEKATPAPADVEKEESEGPQEETEKAHEEGTINNPESEPTEREVKSE